MQRQLGIQAFVACPAAPPSLARPGRAVILAALRPLTARRCNLPGELRLRRLQGSPAARNRLNDGSCPGADRGDQLGKGPSRQAATARFTSGNASQPVADNPATTSAKTSNATSTRRNLVKRRLNVEHSCNLIATQAI
jgi:hypothetical protein